jgi:hypothetical protein
VDQGAGLTIQDWVRPGAVRVDLSGQGLLWKHSAQGERPRRSPARAHLLDEFLRLADAQPEAVAGYAKKYGVLLICRHGLPSSHQTAPFSRKRKPTWVSKYVAVEGGRAVTRATAWFDRCRLRVRQNGWYWEPIAAWRRYAQEARAILAVAAALHENDLGDHRDWRTLYCPEQQWVCPRCSAGNPADVDHCRSCDRCWPVPTLAEARILLALFVQGWLNTAGTKLSFSWGVNPSISLGSDSLFGALAVQLISAIVGHGVSLCSGCRLPYLPVRRPALGRHSFCQKCGTRAAWRISKARRRAAVSDVKTESRSAAIAPAQAGQASELRGASRSTRASAGKRPKSSHRQGRNAR